MPWKVINENKRGGRRETLEGVRIRSRWFGSIKDGMELGKLETSVKFQQAFPPEKREKFGYWINLWKILFSTRAPLLLHTGPRKTYHLLRNFHLGSILLLYHLIKTFLPKRVYERDSRSNKTFETEIYFTATVNRAGKKERKRRNFLFLNLSKGKSLIYISKKLSIYPYNNTYPDYIPDQGRHEHIIQLHVLVLQDILLRRTEKRKEKKKEGNGEKITAGNSGIRLLNYLNSIPLSDHFYLETSTGTILDHDAYVWRVGARPDESVQIIVSQVTHLRKTRSSS